MRIALIPGSFDPITLGHVNVIERAAKMFDKVYVAVMINDAAKYDSSLSSKQYMFSMEERLHIARISLAHIENAEVIARTGMLIDLFDELSATAIVKATTLGTATSMWARSSSVYSGSTPRYGRMSAMMLLAVGAT